MAPTSNEFAPTATDSLPDAGRAAGAASYTSTSQLSRPVLSDWEQTQQVRWALLDAPRLSVVRGGVKRDWRSGLPMAAGMGFICLLIAGLAHWPYHARAVAAPLSVSATRPATARRIAAASQTITPLQVYTSPYGTLTAAGSYYRRIARPVPGYGSGYISPARPNILAQVPPRCPDHEHGRVFPLLLLMRRVPATPVAFTFLQPFHCTLHLSSLSTAITNK